MPAFRPNFTKMGQNHSDHNKDNYYYFCPIIVHKSIFKRYKSI